MTLSVGKEGVKNVVTKFHIISRGNKWALVKSGASKALAVCDDFTFIFHNKDGSVKSIWTKQEIL